jgi:prolyl 4-hydroxylase
VNMTPALSDWIDQQLKRGCNPNDMVEAMVTVGHDKHVAHEYVFAAAARLSHAEAPGITSNSATRLKVPEPLDSSLSDGPHQVTFDEVPVRVLMNLRMPRVVVFEGVLSDRDCDALIAESRPKLERSRTVNRESGGTELNAARTSEGTYFHHTESELLIRINQRIAALTRWPLENGEPLQILHYGVGAQYEPHYDYFDVADPGTEKLVATGGQRVATLITYLNTPDAGGATIFPELGLEIAPIKGNAVFFSYDHPHPNTLTLHGGTPVAQGEKWIATRWMRELPYR